MPPHSEGILYAQRTSGCFLQQTVSFYHGNHVVTTDDCQGVSNVCMLVHSYQNKWKESAREH